MGTVFEREFRHWVRRSESRPVRRSDTQHQALAQANHWMVGLTAGALYALARRRVLRTDSGKGVLFGLAFWLIFDEIVTVAAGLARPPQEYPWLAHARGLAGHVRTESSRIQRSTCLTESRERAEAAACRLGTYRVGDRSC